MIYGLVTLILRVCLEAGDYLKNLTIKNFHGTLFPMYQVLFLNGELIMDFDLDPNVKDSVTGLVTDFLKRTEQNDPLATKESLIQNLENNIPGHTFDVNMQNGDKLQINVRITPKSASTSFELHFK